MASHKILEHHKQFSEKLFETMKGFCPGVSELEPYEFRYGLAELIPEKGWGSVQLDDKGKIEERINSKDFYDLIQIKPRKDNLIVLDSEIIRLAQMLFVGLVTEKYTKAWVEENFYFDIRSFFFFHRTTYLTTKVLAHFGGEPYQRFEQKQKQLERLQDVGYKAFRESNTEVDDLFIRSVKKLVANHGMPAIIAIAGATAAGKTEIVERLETAFKEANQETTSIELDNFFTDRDEREARGIDSRGKEALHFSLFQRALDDLIHGKRINTPRYNFIDGTSSHDLEGRLKPGRIPVEIKPADIIFIEGNFPFLIEEIKQLIDLKVVYLTDDPIRLKRKWKRDIDLRKKYDISYLRNRYFKDQFLMAQFSYIPQLEVCDIAVDTTGAALWVTPEISKILDKD